MTSRRHKPRKNARDVDRLAKALAGLARASNAGRGAQISLKLHQAIDS